MNNLNKSSIPIIQIVGYKNSGKTTLICHLIKRFQRSGLRIGTIKHDAHEFEIDRPSTDTWRHRTAGATVVAITSPSQTAYMEQQPLSLDEIIKRMSNVDLILVEGFKHATHPKVFIMRNNDEVERSLLQELTSVVAIMTHTPTNGIQSDPVFHNEQLFHIDQVDELFELLSALVRQFMERR